MYFAWTCWRRNEEMKEKLYALNLVENVKMVRQFIYAEQDLRKINRKGAWLVLGEFHYKVLFLLLNSKANQ